MSARDDALQMYRCAVDAVRPLRLIRDTCRLEEEKLHIQEQSYDLARFANIYVVGSGKAAGPMAHALEALLEDRIAGGVIVVPETIGALRYVNVIKGSHPIPDAGSLEGARALQDMIASVQEDDLVIYLLSGGSSALIEAPIDPITLDELRLTTQLLLAHGLDIAAVNTVRKHISSIKGGRLGALCRAECAVLVVSDVIGDDLDVIGSAPMYRDTSSFEDARRLLDERNVFEKLPVSVQRIILQGCNGTIEESPVSVRSNIRHFLIGSNQKALEAAAAEAVRRGYSVDLVDAPLEGDADRMGPELIKCARALPDDGRPRCIIYGGETTVEVKGSGKGGRNQQLCLSALSEMRQGEPIALLCAGSDGIDGNSDAAGAVVDAESLKQAELLGLKIRAFLDDNNAYAFFDQTDDLIITGASGTNVMDIAIVVRHPQGFDIMKNTETR